MATTTIVSQLSCFSAINRQVHLYRSSISRPFPSLSASSKLSVVMKLEGGRLAGTSGSKVNTSLNYSTDDSKQYVEENGSPDPGKAYGSAKIHDFCFGIPYGSLVLGGGVLGFLFSRNPTTLGTGLLFGGALLALSFLSLKIWRQGKSSIPFVLGQAVLSATLLWKNFQAYSLTKKLIPTGLYVVISAAMLSFYSYVMLSGGNPPPKKLHS